MKGFMADDPSAGDRDESPNYLLDQLLGRWRQVKTVGMTKYLEAEGENWIYRKMAAIASPDFIFTKESEK